MHEAIISYLKSSSRISSNRYVKFKKDIQSNEIIPVRYLEEGQSSIYEKFPFKDYVSHSTFLKYLKKSKIYKNPYRLTDLCDYCEWAKNKKKDLLKICLAHEKFEDEFNTQALMQFFLEKKRAATAENRPHSLIAEYEKIQQRVVVHNSIDHNSMNQLSSIKKKNYHKSRFCFFY